MEKTLYTLIVYSENIAGLLNQITAVFTRRQINIESLNVSSSSIQGVHKYTITAWTDKETIEKVVKQIEKKIEQAAGCMLQFVRSGRIAITKSCVERVNEYLAERKAKYCQCKSELEG